MSEPTTFGTTPDPSESSAPAPTASAPAPSTPRWLKVTAVGAATASVLALAAVGVAAAGRGGPDGHGPERAHVELRTASHAAAGPMAGAGHVEGVRGRMAERVGAQRAGATGRQGAEARGAAMAARRQALADALGVDVADLTAAMEVGRAAGRDAHLAAVADALGVEVADLEAAMGELGTGGPRGRHGAAGTATEDAPTADDAA